jgi:hypothetical protein
MKRVVSLMIVMAFFLGGMSTALKAQTKKQEREEKRAERIARDKAAGEAAFQVAAQALTDQSFVLQANTIQPLNGRVFYVNSNTNFVSLNNGQATVQVASTFNPNPGPNGLGGITVQGQASNVQLEQEKNGNVYMNFNVQGVFISATVSIVLYSGNNSATVLIDPNFSGNNLTMTGPIVPYGESTVFQGTTMP